MVCIYPINEFQRESNSERTLVYLKIGKLILSLMPHEPIAINEYSTRTR